MKIGTDLKCCGHRALVLCAPVPLCREGVEVKPIWELTLVWIWEHVQLCADSSCFLPGPSAQPELLHSPHLRSVHHSHHAGPYVGGALHEPRGGDGLEGAGNMLRLVLEVAPLPEIPFLSGLELLLAWTQCFGYSKFLGGLINECFHGTDPAGLKDRFKLPPDRLEPS